MKSQMLFLREVLLELGTWCCVSTSFDLKTIEARVKHEGLSFLTITLPTFAKDLEKGLDQGRVDRNLFLPFQKKGRVGGLPRFLGGFLGLVFDRETGWLLSEPNFAAIYAIRQISLLYSKIELPCSQERENLAIERYIQSDKEIRTADIALGNRDGYNSESNFRRVSSLLFRDILTEVDLSVYRGEHVPRVSSGSVADGLRGNAKYRSQLWTDRLERYFPVGEFLIPNWSFAHYLSSVTSLEPGSEIPVEVISVPKTLKAPRIIAREPFAMQYAQQALLERFEESVELDKLGGRFVSWSSQIQNQRLARLGSARGDLATLDLSEASDRVSNQLVRSLLRNHPHLAAAVDACRSRKADVPNHGVIRLARFASMGSALCFPMEAMVFCTIVFLGIEKELNQPLTRNLIKQFLGQVRVYGDDIIVPVEYTLSVISALQDFGLVVNENKSFWTGKFRESCGKDYYDGHDVSVVKVRREFPTERRHVSEIQSIVSLRNQLYLKGFRSTVDWLDERIVRIIPFPYVGPESPALGRISSTGYQTDRWDAKLQRPLVRAAVAVPRIPKSFLDDYGALLKFFLKRGLSPLELRHLERAGRPNTVDIKIRWTVAY